MLMGSCFTENMGERMRQLGFDVMVNPFGILYNPLSMADALRRILDDDGIGEEHLVFRDGLWHSWLHHGSFSRQDKTECISACNDELHRAHVFMKRCDTIIVTMGSAWYYKINEKEDENENDSPIVANCHKVPAAMFSKNIATVEEVVSAWSPLLARLSDMGKRVVFTVSPVRHSAYGAHGNQLGKAVLLLAIEKLLPPPPARDRSVSLITNHDSLITYFPAYEIVVDELRDYRFYADDMNHPSSLAEEIIWQRFQEAMMTPDTISKCGEAEQTIKRSAHRQIVQQ